MKMEFNCDSLTKFFVCVILLLTVESHAHASSVDKSEILRKDVQMSERLKQKPSFFDRMKTKPDEASSISTTVKGISQVIDVFLIKKSLRFDLLTCGEATPHIRDLVDNVMSEIGKQISTEVLQIPNINNCIEHMLKRSAMIFFHKHENVISFNENNHYNKVVHEFLPAYYKIFIYVEEDATGISNFHTPKLEVI
jgi:hypothetical protein